MGQLVLSRKQGEIIHIGDDISVMIVRIGPNVVRVGIEAPRGINVRRHEVADTRESRRAKGEGED